ncbi:hypothetical protein [Streptomyces microflavus]|uniref:hypothetical protein n=1 Tax=Streptomyces microflavus TaxID=1919 RepID=UPI003B217E85
MAATTAPPSEKREAHQVHGAEACVLDHGADLFGELLDGQRCAVVLGGLAAGQFGKDDGVAAGELLEEVAEGDLAALAHAVHEQQGRTLAGHGVVDTRVTDGDRGHDGSPPVTT